VAILAGLVVVMLVTFTASPWPGALLIRSVFENGAAKVKISLEAHTPHGVTRIANQHYSPGDAAAMLDVYYPEGIAAGTALPVIMWTHGGAWISGSKDDDIPYFEILASKGYTVVAPNYSVGPEEKYPTAVHQLNSALEYLQHNAERFHIDDSRVVLAGDSAGSQLVSQLATIITNPGYAGEMDVTPALSPGQLKGVVLACGVYDMAALNGLPGIVGWGFDIATWSYTGIRNYADDPNMKQMSTIDYVTSEFPPAFITGGNDDGLTSIQSKPFAAKLDSLGVQTTTLFFPKNYKPGLPHEYQFNLDNAAGQDALAQILDFLGAHLGTP
jgi:acetyl esterase/lipase